MGSRNGVLLLNVVPVATEISIASSTGENPVDIESLLLFLETMLLQKSDLELLVQSSQQRNTYQSQRLIVADPPIPAWLSRKVLLVTTGFDSHSQ